MTSQRQTLEQRRAAKAWSQIETVTADAQAKYGTLARKLPAMIQINGLGSTLAFLQAKGKNKSGDGHTFIFKHLSEWVLGYLTTEKSSNDLLEFIRKESTDMEAYRRATAEAIEYGIWLKRYVEAKDWGSEGDTE